MMKQAVHDRPILVVVGTRPEGIKMIPVYLALKNAGLPTLLCSTGQHGELLDQVFELFGVTPDTTMQIMRQGQDLFYLTQSVLQKSKELFAQVHPSLVLVQGDTTSTMGAALAAFYLGIPVGHVEAGLRTDDLRSPFPEEMNRRMVGMLADYHFAPTMYSAANLLAEGVDRNKVFCTGNTVVDALRIFQQKLSMGILTVHQDLVDKVETAKKTGKKIMLLTVHRRESFDGGVVRILGAMHAFLCEHPEVICIYPYHPNPAVINAIAAAHLDALPNMHLSDPLPYAQLVYLLMHADWVATDSGGIQEEAVSLGKPVMVLRATSERMEGVWAGLAEIVGSDTGQMLLWLERMASSVGGEPSRTTTNFVTDVYGDGYAAEKIVTILQNHLTNINVIKVHSSDHIGTAVLEVKRPFDTSTCAKVLAGTQDEGLIKKTREFTMKKVSILGLGYIGLPTAIVMAEHGFKVAGFDIDQHRIARLNAGDPVIQEPEIFEKLQFVRASGNFKAYDQLEAADCFIIAVPTPFKGNKEADLSYVMNATERIAEVLSIGNVVILESTVPVGTTMQIAAVLEAKTSLIAGQDFFVAHCPERVLPGKIFQELIENPRIIGGINRISVDTAKEYYKPFIKGTLYLTDAATAEMVKLVENSSRDVQIAFAHQVASMAYAQGLDPYEVIELANKHPRVNILNPSCGVGGHCIAVDPWFLIESFPEQTALLQAAREVNDDKPHEIVAAIKKAVHRWSATHEGICTVLLLGATYKPDVDDLRESPALHVAHLLQSSSEIELLVCEPHVPKKSLEVMVAGQIVTVTEGIERADVVVYLVGHKRFKALDKKSLADKTVLDFCGILHEPRKIENTQEQLFWPARSKSSEHSIDMVSREHTEHVEEL